MFGIETREIGVCNFDYFSVDMLDGEYRMGGKTVVLGDLFARLQIFRGILSQSFCVSAEN